MNKVVTIPKELTREGNLVVIPRTEYEELLRLKKYIPLVDLSAEEKRALRAGRREVRSGKFVTLSRLKDEMGS